MDLNKLLQERESLRGAILNLAEARNNLHMRRIVNEDIKLELNDISKEIRYLLSKYHQRLDDITKIIEPLWCMRCEDWTGEEVFNERTNSHKLRCTKCGRGWV